MALTLKNVVIDCPDPLALMAFWSAALGYQREGNWDEFIWLVDPTGRHPRLGLQQSDVAVAGKNRVHFDLYADDLEAEVERLVGLGAAKLRAHEFESIRWCVLQDPAGNEFCVAAGH